MSIIGLLIGIGGFLVALLVIYGIFWDGIIGTFREKWEADAYSRGWDEATAHHKTKPKGD